MRLGASPPSSHAVETRRRRLSSLWQAPMTVMTDDGIGHTRPARSQDTKAAVEYLHASGAVAITITEHDGVCSFHVGSKIDPRAISLQWLPEANAGAIVRQARRDAGESPNTPTAARALAQATADQRATLTQREARRFTPGGFFLGWRSASHCYNACMAPVI
jgi:hypothetical protein